MKNNEKQNNKIREVRRTVISLLQYNPSTSKEYNLNLYMSPSGIIDIDCIPPSVGTSILETPLQWSAIAFSGLAVKQSSRYQFLVWNYYSNKIYTVSKY